MLATVYDRNGNAIYQESVDYKTPRTFSQYQLGNEDTVFNMYYRDYCTIVLSNIDGQIIETLIKPVFVDLQRWDNLQPNTPEYIAGLNTVIQSLQYTGKVRVEFNYEGRTRHETAAHKLYGVLQEMGYSNVKATIDDYTFILEVNA